MAEPNLAAYRAIAALAPKPRPAPPITPRMARAHLARVAKPIPRLVVNPERVACPVCKAPRGEGCETPSLRQPLADHHLDRIAAARVLVARERRQRAAKRMAA